MASSCKLTSAIVNAGELRFAQEISTEAGPGSRSLEGRTIKEPGDDAKTSAALPPIMTWLASAPPQKPWPANSKRSLTAAKRGAELTSIDGLAPSSAESTAVGTRPGRPSMDAKITPGVRGATNKERPVISVVSRSPFEKFTLTPGVNRPFASNTASVALSPDTIRRGNNKMRAPEAGGACCAKTAPKKRHPAAQRIVAGKQGRLKDMRGL